MKQQSLFDPAIKKAVFLRADSPKHAFYHIWVHSLAGWFFVVKESGVDNTVLDRREWKFQDFAAAEKRFEKIVREKTDPNRKSPRKYKIENQAEILAA